ncbi:hypothetical protein CN692_23620 [Bacillus sp. AFS002410]|uniref:hypothetical protein n=1 Tax=Bacillus sp. AFS002410 TaxID=2033481 RepID=UPI000BF1D1C0|nr:hypothetical protein [Bacillus sp. AFS002410]PEJ48450.1 hypothetical protein CN692_23620 [Bacillus sp. AFS002410]
MDIKLNAEVYKLGLTLGFLRIEDVIMWADNVIDQLDFPPYEIIELSLSSKENLEKIILKLMMIQGEFDNDLPPKILLGLLNEYLNTTKDMFNVIKIMDKLIKHLPDSCEWIELEIHFLSDGFYLAEQQIYGELKDVQNNLRLFLEQFIVYTKYLS